MGLFVYHEQPQPDLSPFLLKPPEKDLRILVIMARQPFGELLPGSEAVTKEGIVKAKSFCFCLVVLLLSGIESGAKDFCVKNAAELQGHLDEAAANTDELNRLMLVRGTYPGRFEYSSNQAKALHIEGGYSTNCAKRSLNHPENTILDGERKGRVLKLYGAAGSSFKLSGLTFQKGIATEGGGIFIAESDTNATISKCRILDNEANEYPGNGGGICRVGDKGTSTLIEYSTIANNRATGNLGSGGGILIRANCQMKYNTITGNFTNGLNEGDGGGVYVQLGTATFIGNHFEGNQARTQSNDSGWGNGGGLICHAEKVKMVNNVFSNNSTASKNGDGAGFFLRAYDGGATTFVILNNTVTQNQAQSTSIYGSGGGFYLETLRETDLATIANNIVYNNSASFMGENIYIANGDNAKIRLWNNDYGDSKIQGICTRAGNVHKDPLFSDPSMQDFHLSTGSPCIDKGRNKVPGRLPAKDIEHKDRIINEIVDMGAYEYQDLNLPL